VQSSINDTKYRIFDLCEFGAGPHTSECTKENILSALVPRRIFLSALAIKNPSFVFFWGLFDDFETCRVRTERTRTVWAETSRFKIRGTWAAVLQRGVTWDAIFQEGGTWAAIIKTLIRGIKGGKTQPCSRTFSVSPEPNRSISVSPEPDRGRSASVRRSRPFSASSELVHGGSAPFFAPSALYPVAVAGSLRNVHGDGSFGILLPRPVSILSRFDF